MQSNRHDLHGPHYARNNKIHRHPCVACKTSWGLNHRTVRACHVERHITSKADTMLALGCFINLSLLSLIVTGWLFHLLPHPWDGVCGLGMCSSLGRLPQELHVASAH